VARGLSLLFVVMALVLSGCSRELKPEPVQQKVAGSYYDTQAWLQSARKHEAEGDLQRALYEYRLARTLSRGGRDIESQIRRLQSKISVRTSKLLKQAEQAERKGRSATARARYLDVLGLRPDHQQALAALRQLDRQGSLVALKSKRGLADQAMAYTGRKRTGKESVERQSPAKVSKRERQTTSEVVKKQSVERNLDQAELSYQAQRWDETLAFLKLAEQATQGNEQSMETIGRARKKYAETLYNHGVISFRNSPQKAIDYWRYAIKFDPSDDKSRLRIRNMTDEEVR
jgi:tetratricopeptide (TPR) repeat protein